MRYKKVYGQSRIDNCPFCGRNAIVNNIQGIPVCLQHKNAEFEELMCSCGGYLDIMHGKYGAFFNCINCGNINFRKGMEINQERIRKTAEKCNKEPKQKNNFEKNEIVVSSDELDFLY